LIRSQPARAGYISDSELLRRAYALAERAHGDQRRATDETRFIEHVIEVGDLLHAAGFDERLVAAGLLHDAVERGELSEAELRAEMDDDICALVMALTEDATIEDFSRRKEALREQVRAGGTRAVTIFAADKLSDIRGLARGVVRSEDSIEARMGTSVEAMARHYEESVRTIETTDPTCPFIDDLRAELDALGLATAPAGPPRPNARAWKRSGWSAVPD
jgi:(p)ppGpp synthase/HD superfamily hydrolase